MRHARQTLLLIFAISMLPASASAQAWVGDPNSMSIAVGYNFGFATSIVETDGQSLGSIRSFQHAINFGVEYVTPLPGLAITAGLPLYGLQYRGTDLPASDFLRPHGSYDDGSTHFLTQDFRADIRYSIAALQDFLALAVSIGGSIPTQSYETEGFAGAGRNLKQLHFGLAVGRTLRPVLDNLYFHVAYDFALSERFKTDFAETGAISQNYSTISAQIGYFILPELQINVATDIRLAHGGVNFLDWDNLDQVVRDFHDVLLRENVYLVGGGVAYDVTETLNVAVVARAFVGGTNTRNAHLFGLNLSYQLF